MSIHIPEHFVIQFKDNVFLLSQQRGSLLRSRVREQSQTGTMQNFDRIGPTEVVEKTTRHDETPQIDTVHDRRWVRMRDFGWADLIDREDKIRMLLDPASPMTQNAVYAVGRKYDELIIAAMHGNAEEGQFGGTLVPFPASQTIAHGGTGLTNTKIQQVYRMFEENNVDMSLGLNFLISPQAHEDMKAETVIISGDFVSRKPLETGSVGYFSGFDFVVSTMLPRVGTTRSCFAWATDGMGLAIGADLYVRSAMRHDRWDAQEIFMAFSAEATRIEDVKVVEIEIVEV